MLGMIGALAADLGRVHMSTRRSFTTGESLFLTPRNLWNLSVQTSSIADHGDRHGARHRHAPHRPVGRIDHRLRLDDRRRRAGPCPAPVYLGLDNPAIWILAVVLAARRSAPRSAPFTARSSPISAFPPSSSPSAAQLFWRGAAWWVTTGQTIAPLDDRFALMGGGPHGSIGATASWALCALACAAIVVRPLRRATAAGAVPLPATADVGRIY